MRWVLRGALLFTLTFANLNDIWSPDVVPNTLVVWSLVREGDVDLDEFTTAGGEAVGPGYTQIPRETYYFRACGVSSFTGTPSAPRSLGGPPPPGPNDHVCSIFPPGITLLALPVLLPFALADPSATDGTLLVRSGHLAAALIETLAALLLWSVARRFTTARWALALILLYWLGTSVRTVATQALWQHAGVHLALAAALWLVLYERAPSMRRELAAGIALGFGVAIRQTTALSALAATRVPRLDAGWPTLALLAGVAVGALPLLLYQQLALGSAFESGYGPKPFDAPILSGLYALLLSPSRGLLVYEPWALAGLAALALAWRRTGHVAERLRTLSLSWLALLLLYASYPEWWGGRVFGSRFLDDLAPLLVAALAWAIGLGLLAPLWARILFWAAAAWSLLLFNAAALAYDPLGWDTVPLNVNFNPERLLDWSDPQWLSVLGSLASANVTVLVAGLLSALILAVLLHLELSRPA
ncbi:MAG: hypothetical protein ACRDGT_13515 [Candidatus Limnocylindria bacterium]